MDTSSRESTTAVVNTLPDWAAWAIGLPVVLVVVFLPVLFALAVGHGFGWLFWLLGV